MNKRHQSHQVPDVQGVRGGINATIGRQSSRFQSLFQTGFTIKRSEKHFSGYSELGGIADETSEPQFGYYG